MLNINFIALWKLPVLLIVMPLCAYLLLSYTAYVFGFWFCCLWLLMFLVPLVVKLTTDNKEGQRTKWTDWCRWKQSLRNMKPLIFQNLSIFWYPCLNAQIFNKVGHFGNFVINESQSWPTNFDWPELFYSEEFRSSVCSSEKSLEWPLIRCIIWSEI